jgi:hypothetical protein
VPSRGSGRQALAGLACGGFSMWRRRSRAAREARSIDVRVCGGGTVAVAIGDYAEVGTDKDGKSFERRTRFTDVWVLKDGAWQGVNGHASAIPTKP